MTIHHHPSQDLLFAYAAGDLGEAWSLVLATHMALCPVSRRVVHQAEAIGGELIDALAPQSLAEDAMTKTLARAAMAETPPSTTVASSSINQPAPVLPQPLLDYAGGDVSSLRWRRLGRGAYHIPLVRSSGGEVARLLKIPAGRPVPEHGHNGIELTMVLCGSFAMKVGVSHAEMWKPQTPSLSINQSPKLAKIAFT